MELSLKWISLIMMLIQNAATPLVFRLATTEQKSSERYDTGVSVVSFEMMKLFASLVLIFVEEGYSMGSALRVIRTQIIDKPKDTLRLAIPATLYFTQNYCLQLASANLPAAMFQVTYQGKTLVVAACSVLLLQKRLTRSKWFAIALMGMGIAVVQLAQAKEKKQEEMANAAEQSVSTGLIFVLIGCLCSGFAGVYFEMMMKMGAGTQAGENQPKPSMWVRNVQLAAFSVLIGVCAITSKGLNKDEATGLARPLFYGFNSSVWIMTVNNALGGLVVAFVIKHADNILKGFACALATVLATVAAVPMFGFELKASFFVGMIVVLGSTFLYGGTIKMQGTWWNTEPALCQSARGDDGEEDDAPLP